MRSFPVRRASARLGRTDQQVPEAGGPDRRGSSAMSALYERGTGASGTPAMRFGCVAGCVGSSASARTQPAPGRRSTPPWNCGSSPPARRVATRWRSTRTAAIATSSRSSPRPSARTASSRSAERSRCRAATPSWRASAVRRRPRQAQEEAAQKRQAGAAAPHRAPQRHERPVRVHPARRGHGGELLHRLHRDRPRSHGPLPGPLRPRRGPLADCAPLRLDGLARHPRRPSAAPTGR